MVDGYGTAEQPDIFINEGWLEEAEDRTSWRASRMTFCMLGVYVLVFKSPEDRGTIRVFLLVRDSTTRERKKEVERERQRERESKRQTEMERDR